LFAMSAVASLVTLGTSARDLSLNAFPLQATPATVNRPLN